MPAPKMHADEVEIDVALVRRLIATQFPKWAGLPLRLVASAGTDNALFRLGSEMAVRLPRIHWANSHIEKERLWLPRLAPHLPLAIPLPLAKGVPAEGYPWEWGVYSWLEGENATRDRISDLRQAATDLAQFILALQQIDTAEAPNAGSQNFFRGAPLSTRDEATRASIALLKDTLDTHAITEAWERALCVPERQGAPVWIHGDLQSGNLLAREGRLCAVIDFGGLGVGDPAGDLIIAWNLFPQSVRDHFRACLSVDDATWARGRGWALSIALIALPYYQDICPAIASMARHTIDAVLTDLG